MGQFVFLCSCRVIALTCYFGKMAPVPAIMDAIYLLLSPMYNDLLRVSGHSPADKIEQQITFPLSYAHLYLFESDDERDNKSATANTFDISCSGGRSGFSL